MEDSRRSQSEGADLDGAFETLSRRHSGGSPNAGIGVGVGTCQGRPIPGRVVIAVGAGGQRHGYNAPVQPVNRHQSSRLDRRLHADKQPLSQFGSSFRRAVVVLPNCYVPGAARKVDLKHAFFLLQAFPCHAREIVAGTAVSFNILRTFRVAILSGSFDHFLDDAERLSSLLNIGRHLEKGGTLVFDVFLGLMQASPLSPAGTVKTGTTEYRRFVGGRLLPGSKKETHLVFEVYQHGRLTERIEECSLVGITSRQAIHQVLAEAGLDVTREWSNYDFTPYREGDTLLLVEAEKRI